MKKSNPILVEGLFGVKTGRSMALRRCVWNTPELRNEFRKTLTYTESHEEFDDKTQAFIREKGLRILSEKPIARVNGDRYVVDVYFTVGW